MLTATQPDWQARLAADPAHAAWSDARQAEDQRAFNEWLDSPEGRVWLAAEERAEETCRYPYGRPAQDTGWYWERPAWGARHDPAPPPHDPRHRRLFPAPERLPLALEY